MHFHLLDVNLRFKMALLKKQKMVKIYPSKILDLAI